jgi:hypothetical protein
MKLKILPLFIVLSTCLLCSCGKKDDPQPPSDPCAGVTISVQATKVDAAPGTANGSITISSPSGAGFTFSLNGGAFAATSSFTNLAAGNYAITAKNASGCTGVGNFVIAVDACIGKTITVTAPTILSATPCATTNDGSITASAAGSTGFTYNISGGAFQASATFNNLAAGNYVVGARDVDGCVRTGSFTVNPKAAGPLFTAVKSLMQGSCNTSGCHVSPNPAGGVDFTVDCNIVSRWDRIKARAVDGIPSFMPPGGQLSAANKQKIVDWVNAGHLYTN